MSTSKLDPPEFFNDQSGYAEYKKKLQRWARITKVDKKQQAEVVVYHLENHPSGMIGIRYDCGKCDFTTKYKQSLAAHNASSHEATTHVCDQCDFIAKTSITLKIHKQGIHDKCEYTNARKKLVKYHKEAIHEGVRHKCSKCQFEAKWRVGLRTHFKAKHGGVEYNCDECEYILLGFIFK